MHGVDRQCMAWIGHLTRSLHASLSVQQHLVAEKQQLTSDSSFARLSAAGIPLGRFRFHLTMFLS